MPVGEVRQDARGNQFRLEADGWKAITPQQAADSQQGPVSTAIGETLGVPADIVSMLTGWQQPQRFQQMREAGSAANPKAALVGRYVIPAVMGSMASRVVSAIQAGAEASGAVGATTGAVGDAGEAAAAQAAAQPLDEFGLPKAPPPTPGVEAPTLVDRLQGALGMRGELTDQQKVAKQAIDSGWVNIKLLPGQAQGNRLMQDAVETNPVWLHEFEPERVANYGAFSDTLKDALMVPKSTPMTDALLSTAAEKLGEGFDSIAAGMVQQPIKLSDRAMQVIEPMIKNNPFFGTEITPERLFELRSGISADTAIPGLEWSKVSGLHSVLDEIDATIEASLRAQGNPQLYAEWRRLQDAWKVKVAMERGAAIGKAGELNIPTVYNNLRKTFGDEFAGWGPRQGISPETARFIDTVKTAAAFKSTVANSGTPTRSLAVDAIRNPAKTALDVIAGKTIRAYATGTVPKSALAAGAAAGVYEANKD